MDVKIDIPITTTSPAMWLVPMDWAAMGEVMHEAYHNRRLKLRVETYEPLANAGRVVLIADPVDDGEMVDCTLTGVCLDLEGMEDLAAGLATVIHAMKRERAGQ